MSRLFGIEVNNFDIERILPDVLYWSFPAGADGQDAPNDARAVEQYLNRLAAHSDLSVAGAEMAGAYSIAGFVPRS